MEHIDLFSSKLGELKAEGKYRIFNDILRQRGKFPKAIWYHKYAIKEIVNWCTNDYLGMGQNSFVIDSMKTALETAGAGSGGTRNISGTTHYHVALEIELAKLHKKEAALLFTSAYVANSTTLETMPKVLDDVVYISDEMNHASIIHGIRHSKARKVIWRHNDLNHLEEILKKETGTKIVVFESVYSMDGDIAPITDIVDLCRKHNAITYIDEVHAVGLYGDKGQGLGNQCDIINGTLSKGFGVQGGYIAGKADFLDTIRSLAPGFIFTTSLSPVVAAGALTSVKWVQDNPEHREKMFRQSRMLKTVLKKNNIPVLDNPSHIVPVMINDPIKCKAISDTLLEDHGIYVQPINYPTVPEGTERLRFTVTPYHTESMILDVADKLKTVLTINKVL